MNKQNTFNPMDELENKTTEELQAYNEVLEQSSEYQRILPKVMKEVYTLFVKERIESLERLAETEEDEDLFGDDGKFPNNDLPWEPTPIEREMNKPSFLITTAKSFLPHDPAHAAEVLSQIGSCHRIWAIQKQILKEKYGITWYTPSELHPEIKYD
jgi:hypothetical protein